MSEHPIVRRTDPEEVFGLLADEIRVGILQALWDNDTGPLSFSELREATGVSDSGQFNYHLGKLVGRFVTRSDDGYDLTQAGKLVNGAIEAGAYTGEATIDPIALEEPCSSCGGDQTLSYEDETVRVSCADCPVEFTFLVPPGVFAGYAEAAIPGVADRYLRSTVLHTLRGFCCLCDGPLEPTVAPLSSLDGVPAETAGEVVEEADRIPMVTYECDRCAQVVTCSLDLVLMEHPAVVSFHYDRGVDVRERPVWNRVRLDPDRISITGTDPFRAQARYALDDAELVVTVDDTLEVVSVEP